MRGQDADRAPPGRARRRPLRRRLPAAPQEAYVPRCCTTISTSTMCWWMSARSAAHLRRDRFRRHAARAAGAGTGQCRLQTAVLQTRRPDRGRRRAAGRLPRRIWRCCAADTLRSSFDADPGAPGADPRRARQHGGQQVDQRPELYRRSMPSRSMRMPCWHWRRSAATKRQKRFNVAIASSQRPVIHPAHPRRARSMPTETAMLACAVARSWGHRPTCSTTSRCTWCAAKAPGSTDITGRRYLDVYNNVPHVGHCHPHVVAAIARQAAILNTNTRYVFDEVLEYAERLGAHDSGRLRPHRPACS